MTDTASESAGGRSSVALSLARVRKRQDRRRSRGLAGLYLVSPYIAFNALFWGFPFIWAFVIGFQTYNLLDTQTHWVGFSNFSAVIHSEELRYTFTNTLIFLAVFTPVTIAAALLIALALNEVPRFSAFFLALFLLPSISPQVGYSLVFKYMFAGDGVINKGLDLMGIAPIPWLTSMTWAMPAISFLVAWRWTGYFALFFFAGLRAVPRELREAAEIDGASSLRAFRHIVWPLLNPAFVTSLVLSIVTAFSLFTEPYLLTNGGPLHATTSFLIVLYDRAFSYLQLGYGSAWAIVTAGISLVLVYLIRRLFERQVYV